MRRSSSNIGRGRYLPDGRPGTTSRSSRPTRTRRRIPDSLLRFNAVAVNNQQRAADHGGPARAAIPASSSSSRSAPNTAWTTLDSVAAKAKDTGTAAYRYIDASPLRGLNDYRLMLVNQDGSTSPLPSPVREVRIKRQALAMFPNPATTQLTLMADPAITGTVTLYTEDGRSVQQRGSAYERDPANDVALHGSARGHLSSGHPAVRWDGIP